ncbi:MAG: hypothetical protein ACE5GX_18445 [Thermoanaerobaculia bacterium]
MDFAQNRAGFRIGEFTEDNPTPLPYAIAPPSGEPTPEALTALIAREAPLFITSD